jgi:flavin reductase (DIM6/NTAB) family NADH-FMN oxidoreductase RutF
MWRIDMKKKTSEVSHLVPCSVVFLSAGNGTKKDAMTATAMFVSEEPPLFVVSVAKHHLTHALIEETGEFVLNVASSGQVKLARSLGSAQGEKVDKFVKFGIETQKGGTVDAPLIKGSYANIECSVITSFPVANYTVYLSHAVDVKVDKTLTPLAWHADRYYAIKDEVK